MSSARWFVGDATGALMPADARTLEAGGIRCLTEALRRYGALSIDNRVTRMTGLEEFSGGSTGCKLVLSVHYEEPAPELPTDLFVKFSRDFDDAYRDHGRTQMESEVRFAALSRGDGFPVAVPTVVFADYHGASGTGVLITERIPFGRNGIEREYAKCMDYDMPDPLGHYRVLLGAVARLAGTHAAGQLPNHLTADMEELSVGERPPLTVGALDRRVDRLGEFAALYPDLLPDNIRSRSFLGRLRADLPRLLDGESMIWRLLRERSDFVALCHWNANVDNAWFWRGADGTLKCGLMDWGCVGQMNVAMAIWGALCSAETEMWDCHLPELLTVFADEFRACGGPTLDVDVLIRHVLLYAAVMGMTWLLDVPGHVRSQVSDLTAESTRMDPGIREVESVRCRLQMMTNVLNLWETHDLGGVLDEMLS
jgi:hypothetical protein